MLKLRSAVSPSCSPTPPRMSAIITLFLLQPFPLHQVSLFVALFFFKSELQQWSACTLKCANPNVLSLKLEKFVVYSAHISIPCSLAPLQVAVYCSASCITLCQQLCCSDTSFFPDLCLSGACLGLSSNTNFSQMHSRLLHFITP